MNFLRYSFEEPRLLFFFVKKGKYTIISRNYMKIEGRKGGKRCQIITG